MQNWMYKNTLSPQKGIPNRDPLSKRSIQEAVGVWTDSCRSEDVEPVLALGRGDLQDETNRAEKAASGRSNSPARLHLGRSTGFNCEMKEKKARCLLIGWKINRAEMDRLHIVLSAIMSSEAQNDGLLRPKNKIKKN
ncbi:hypothetical protein HPP92_017727 [Vanilla planifolia]|uniref:Uncharacterized protein n=1 Tax=Vanilla planifolia TaxID=51239 RepID=A0A835UM75_VANPL|nr:hypothetical protein HPP92_017727 [Vanilla planifolia]